MMKCDQCNANGKIVKTLMNGVVEIKRCNCEGAKSISISNKIKFERKLKEMQEWMKEHG